MSAMQPTIMRFESLPSTNSEAARRAMAGAAEGLVILAGEQTAGRGRLDREWLSPAGAGLYFSLVLRPSVGAGFWSLLPLMAALAVNEALLDSCGLETDIKWPNDILARGRKLCGILAETVETSAGRAVILGIGINLNVGAFPAELAGVATSVQNELGAGPDAERLLEALIRALVVRYMSFQAGDDPGMIRDEWARRSSYATGKLVNVACVNEEFAGTTRGLESDGALRVETEAGEMRIVRAGDVTGLRPANSSN
jgi:BirA family transcriptional regulator, biotin operon repressor / biotin---[acetyl-CoA-carboxylase] ligase